MPAHTERCRIPNKRKSAREYLPELASGSCSAAETLKRGKLSVAGNRRVWSGFPEAYKSSRIVLTDTYQSIHLIAAARILHSFTGQGGGGTVHSPQNSVGKLLKKHQILASSFI